MTSRPTRSLCPGPVESTSADCGSGQRARLHDPAPRGAGGSTPPAEDTASLPKRVPGRRRRAMSTGNRRAGVSLVGDQGLEPWNLCRVNENHRPVTASSIGSSRVTKGHESAGPAAHRNRGSTADDDPSAEAGGRFSRHFRATAAPPPRHRSTENGAADRQACRRVGTPGATPLRLSRPPLARAAPAHPVGETEVLPEPLHTVVRVARTSAQLR
jgi:hypothetical protein